MADLPLAAPVVSGKSPTTYNPVIGEPGLFDLPAAAYHQDPVVTPSLSSSIAKLLIDHTPLHAWWQCPRLNPAATFTSNAKTTFGSACHELFLGKGGGIHRIASIHKDTGEVVTDYKTAAARSERDEAIAAGKVPIMAAEYDRAIAVVEAAMDQLGWLGIDGHSEITGVAEFNGVWTRQLMDRLLDDQRTIIDLKFTEASASPAEWPRQAARMGYDVQQGHYRLGLAEIEGVGIERIEFLFIVVELGPPVMACVHRLPFELEEAGLEKAVRAREIWGECLKSNHWPGYGQKIHMGDPPMYAVAAWENQKMASKLDWHDGGDTAPIKRDVFVA